MNMDDVDHGGAHLAGDGATDPFEPSGRALAALLLLAGSSQRRRRALPAQPLTAHSGLSNCRFYCSGPMK
ncbi:MAG: hypothetical protein Q7U52_11000 [Hydrogenophaga sp.]|nr:hypothetical protein [Hydrogenophaga sp.]